MEGIFALGTTFQDDVADGTESVGAVVVSTTVSVVAVESVVAVSDTDESEDDESDEQEARASIATTIAILRMSQS